MKSQESKLANESKGRSKEEDVEKLVDLSMKEKQYCPRKIRTLQLREMLFDENLINTNLKILFSSPKPTVFKKSNKAQETGTKPVPIVSQQKRRQVPLHRPQKLSIENDIHNRLELLLQNFKVSQSQNLRQLCTMKVGQLDPFQ